MWRIYESLGLPGLSSVFAALSALGVLAGLPMQ